MYILFNPIVPPIIISEKIAYQKPAKIGYFRPFLVPHFAPKRYTCSPQHTTGRVYMLLAGGYLPHLSVHVPIISHLESRDKFATSSQTTSAAAVNLRTTCEQLAKNWRKGCEQLAKSKRLRKNHTQRLLYNTIKGTMVILPWLPYYSMDLSTQKGLDRSEKILYCLYKEKGLYKHIFGTTSQKDPQCR